MNSKMLTYLQRLLHPILFTFSSSGLECAMTLISVDHMTKQRALVCDTYKKETTRE